MPFPSGGCRTCKARRIKCDESLPTCIRCVKANRICSWTGVGVVHRSENYYASGRVKRPRGPRGGEARTSDAILSCPSTDLKTIAILHYQKNYVRSPDEAPPVLKGLTDDLLQAWTPAPKRPVILDLAVTAMAMAVFSRTQSYPPAAIEASVVYLQLLHVAQSAIPSMEPTDIDSYLLAIFLMGRYENVVYRIDEDLSLKLSCAAVLRSFSHHDGALATLKLWKDQQSPTQPASSVIKHTRRCMIKSSLLRTLAIPDWMTDGALFSECAWELEYDRLLVQVANLRQQFSVLSREGSLQECNTNEMMVKARKLNEEASIIEKGLKTWIASYATTTSISKHSVNDWQSKGLYNSDIYSFPSVADAAVCLLYYSIRLFVYSTKLKILDFRQLNSDGLARLECLSEIHSIAHNVASTLPFCLQQIQTARSSDSSVLWNEKSIVKPSLAEMAIWPLTIVAGVDELEESQRSWFRAQLASLGRNIGDRVIELDPADWWFQL